ncbi:DUF6776 family protein [Thiohalocapsa sp. ML1]|uniref:DUF6776 family protein n=1 Tax=Thiohalocapsa sp. ML1 TaxID=1431688 RepID=UPI000731F2FF|nr:DUF6776 family protein [Thiohalocapsa sp. ML1]
MPSFPDLRRTSDLATAATETGAGQGRRGRHWWLVTIGWLGVVAAAFVLGYLLSAHDAKRFSARIQALQMERDLLTEQLAEQRAAEAKLRRSHQIDVEAQRAAKVQISMLEDERVRLEQRLGYLKALIDAGGRGIVDVHALDVTPAGDGEFDYRLSLSQLIASVPQTEGEVMLALASRQDGARRVTPLAELGVGDAGRHLMQFGDVAEFTGRFQCEDGVEPESLIVEIVPKGDNLLPSRHVISWKAAVAGNQEFPASKPQR